MKYKLIVPVLVAFFALLAGSAWHKDDQCAAGVSDTPALSGNVVKQAPDSSENKGQTKSQTMVIAYYFHTTYRCVSCKKIEAYSREAIESGFAEQLKNGTLQFLSVNIDESENKRFVKDYQLYTKSLVICDMENGKQKEWKNLTKVWQLIRNKDEFVKYVQDEINNYLKES